MLGDSALRAFGFVGSAEGDEMRKQRMESILRDNPELAANLSGQQKIDYEAAADARARAEESARLAAKTAKENEIRRQYELQDRQSRIEHQMVDAINTMNEQLKNKK